MMLDWYILLVAILPGVLYYFFVQENWKKSAIFTLVFLALPSLIIKIFHTKLVGLAEQYPRLQAMMDNNIIAALIIGSIVALLFYVILWAMEQKSSVKTITIMAGLYITSLYLIAISLFEETLGRGASASEVMGGIGDRWDALVGWFKGLDAVTYVLVIAGIIFLIFAFAKASEK